MIRRATLLAAATGLLAAACSDASNQVVGGVNTSPPLIIRAVRSKLHAVVTSTDANGVTSTANAIVLSETENLCDLIGAKPELLRAKEGTYVAILLLTPPDKSGTFYFGASAPIAASFSANDDTGQLPLVFVGAAGSISIGEFQTNGNATGTFDILFADTNANRFEAYGKFKTDPCPALEHAFVPRY